MRDVNDQYNSVTENWMKGTYDDGVKNWWPLKNGNLIVKLEDDAGVDDQDSVSSINQLPCHVGSYISAHSIRLLNNNIREMDGFYSNNCFYLDTHKAYTLKKESSTLVDPSELVEMITVNRVYSKHGL